MTMNFPSVWLLRLYWTGVFGFAVYVILALGTMGPVHVFGGAVVGALALLPSYLWCSGRVPGLPIFPLFALTYLWTYSLPLMTEHPMVARFEDAAVLTAGLTVAMFLGLATLLWYHVVRKPVAVPTSYFSVPDGSKSVLFSGCLLAACVFQMCTLAGLFWNFPVSAFSLIRAVTMSLATLGITVQSYRFGRRELSKAEAVTYLALISSMLVLSAAGLILASALAMFLIAVGTFTVGRGRLPVTILLVMFPIVSVLHVGKKQMRDDYWGPKGRAVYPWDYPGLYARWFTTGLAQMPNLLEPDDRATKGRQAGFVERASVVQMLMLVQSKSGEEVAYLGGETYWIIPELLVPRFLHESKPWSHEGTYLLSIHYGLQTREQTRRTTIGFGLLAEAYANFGYTGVAALALLLGGGFALVTRWSLAVPITSVWGLFGLLVFGLAVQTEHTAGVVVTSLFQGTVTLLAFALCTMSRHTVAVPSPPLIPQGAVP